MYALVASTNIAMISSVRCEKYLLFLVVDCGLPPRFLHSTVTASNTTHSNIARYDCDEGYRGEARLTCTADGSWYGNDPNCTSKINLNIYDSEWLERDVFVSKKE